MRFPPISTIQVSQAPHISQPPPHSSYQYIGGGPPTSSYQIPTLNMGHYVPNVPNQQPNLIKEIQDMNNLIKNLKEGTNKRTYSF